jgi:hypothetical protein
MLHLVVGDYAGLKLHYKYNCLMIFYDGEYI